MGLYSEYYARLRTQILSTEPLPSLDRAYQLVVQDERVRLSKSVPDDQSSSVLGFALRAGSSPGRGTGDRPVCTLCHKVGHDVSKCWSFLVCTHCKKNGHEIGNCYELVDYPENFGSGRGSSTLSGRGSSTCVVVALQNLTPFMLWVLHLQIQMTLLPLYLPMVNGKLLPGFLVIQKFLMIV